MQWWAAETHVSQRFSVLGVFTPSLGATAAVWTEDECRVPSELLRKARTTLGGTRALLPQLGRLSRLLLFYL